MKHYNEFANILFKAQHQTEQHPGESVIFNYFKDNKLDLQWMLKTAKQHIELKDVNESFDTNLLINDTTCGDPVIVYMKDVNDRIVFAYGRNYDIKCDEYETTIMHNTTKFDAKRLETAIKKVITASLNSKNKLKPIVYILNFCLCPKIETKFTTSGPSYVLYACERNKLERERRVHWLRYSKVIEHVLSQFTLSKEYLTDSTLSIMHSKIAEILADKLHWFDDSCKELQIIKKDDDYNSRKMYIDYYIKIRAGKFIRNDYVYLDALHGDYKSILRQWCYNFVSIHSSSWQAKFSIYDILNYITNRKY